MRNHTYNSLMRDFVNLANSVNRPFNVAYDYTSNGGSSEAATEGKRSYRLPVDAWSDENGFTFKAYLPGVDPADVEIVYEGDDLIIRGEIRPFDIGANDEGESSVEMIRRELFHGAFERRFSFNTAVEVDNITAEFENGVLTLTVPKAEEVKPKQIAVKAK